MIGVGRVQGNVSASSVGVRLLRPRGNIQGRRTIRLYFSRIGVRYPPAIISNTVQVNVFGDQYAVGVKRHVVVFTRVTKGPVRSSTSSFFVHFFRGVPRLGRVPMAHDRHRMPNSLVTPEDFRQVFRRERRFSIHMTRFLRV